MRIGASASSEPLAQTVQADLCRQLHLGATFKEAAHSSSYHIACQTAMAAVEINPHKQTDA